MPLSISVMCSWVAAGTGTSRTLPSSSSSSTQLTLQHLPRVIPVALATRRTLGEDEIVEL